jgi:hypothetical protein
LYFELWGGLVAQYKPAAQTSELSISLLATDSLPGASGLHFDFGEWALGRSAHQICGSRKPAVCGEFDGPMFTPLALLLLGKNEEFGKAQPGAAVSPNVCNGSNGLAIGSPL